MAITERDYILVRDLDKVRTWMMLRSDRHFHLVRVDAALTEREYERLMKRYPCGMREFQEMGLHVTPLNRENCTHAILEGTKEGERLTLWFSGDIRKYTLGADYSRERLEAFFDTQQRRWDIIPEPEGPTVQMTRTIGWTLNGTSYGLLLFAIFCRGFPGRWMAVLSLLVFAAAVVLCIRWPGRFTISGVRKAFRGRRAAYRFDMEFPLLIPPLVMVLDVFEGYTYRSVLPLLIWGAVLGLSVGILLIWASRKYRSVISGAIGLTIGLMLLSGGIVAQGNQLLDFGPPTTYTVTVEETEQYRGGRGGTRYYCYVTMPDGVQEQFSIPWSRYKELSPGDPITIIVHDGALGLEYLTIDWDE